MFFGGIIMLFIDNQTPNNFVFVTNTVQSNVQLKKEKSLLYFQFNKKGGN